MVASTTYYCALFLVMNASIQKYLNHFLSDKLSLRISTLNFYPVGGGSINETCQVIVNDQTKFFLKINSATKYPKLFRKEKRGIEFLNDKKIFRILSVIAHDEIDNYQILLLDWIEGGLKTERFWRKFGEQLAALHQITNPYFGFEEDNYMGALPQQNDHHSIWHEFFVNCRLRPQVNMAKNNRMLHSRHLNAFENLFLELKNIFNNERPALLHGDLWSGNFMCDQDSSPVLIDPAVYFGHRSVDLAMTTLFGGFDRAFYEAYNYHLPFPKNYEEQWNVCNLYPLLVHLNLFGVGYLGQIERTLMRFQ